jgi:hypothetical protein
MQTIFPFREKLPCENIAPLPPAIPFWVSTSGNAKYDYDPNRDIFVWYRRQLGAISAYGLMVSEAQKARGCGSR